MVTPPLTLHACIFWKLLVQFTHDTLNISKGSADMFPKIGENAASPAPHFLSQIKTVTLKIVDDNSSYSQKQHGLNIKIA